MFRSNAKKALEANARQAEKEARDFRKTLAKGKKDPRVNAESIKNGEKLARQLNRDARVARARAGSRPSRWF